MTDKPDNQPSNSELGEDAFDLGTFLSDGPEGEEGSVEEFDISMDSDDQGDEFTLDMSLSDEDDFEFDAADQQLDDDPSIGDAFSPDGDDPDHADHDHEDEPDEQAADTERSEQQEDDETPEREVPRVALMGEFSAGKSTLTNLLLGAKPLPVRITATRLPPVWLTLGDGPSVREDMEGEVHELGEDGLDGVQMENTRLIQMQMQSEILEMCDLVDMPGISDPNMDSHVWRDVVEHADVLVWCTHATQAWRQSEAAAYESLPEELKKKSILLITRYDKLTSERDKKRVMARVRAETKGLFRAVFPVALLGALSAGEDKESWEKSGAEPFLKALMTLITQPDADLVEEPTPEQKAEEQPEPAMPEADRVTPVRPVRVKSSRPKQPLVTPRRVVRAGNSARHG